MPHHDTDVLIAGAGPVGLVLAMDLSARGVRVTVVEPRPDGEPPSVKCNHVSARSMETLRRLGLADAVRDVGLPADHPNDVVFRTTMTGVELARIPIPCRRDRFFDTSGPDGWWPTPEPPHRVNQIYLEPVLLRGAKQRAGLTLRHRARVARFAQDRDGVDVGVEALDGGGTLNVRARYLVGCDGGASTVRKALGVRLEGTAVVQRVQSTHIRAPGLAERLPGRAAWAYYSINPRRCGTVFAIDGRETWLVHNHLNADEPEFDSVDRDASIRRILGVDAGFDYEVVSKEDWVGRRLVAERFRDGRVFIAGDAAHLWVPYAGYGMNAGIADAANLAWHLSAQVRGWAAPAALDAYERERRPITEQVSRFAMDHAAAMIKARGAVPPDLEAPDAHGQVLRTQVGRAAYDLNVAQFCCAGLNFGYFYDDSPLIARGDEAPPGYTMGTFAESTAPGCRAPHVWLRDGRSLYDAFGADYTLLTTRAPAAGAAQALLDAAATAGVPMTGLDVSAEALPQAYRHGLVLCRPDQHVAWRGDAAPPDVAGWLERLRGGSGD